MEQKTDPQTERNLNQSERCPGQIERYYQHMVVLQKVMRSDSEKGSYLQSLVVKHAQALVIVVQRAAS